MGRKKKNEGNEMEAPVATEDMETPMGEVMPPAEVPKAPEPEVSSRPLSSPSDKGKDNVVEVRYNAKGVWTLDMGAEGREVMIPGSTKEFDVTNRVHLHQLLQIIKQVGQGRINTQSYIVKNDPEPMKYRKRFEIINGLENLPPVLRDIKFRHSKMPSKEEREAIVSLCPDYFEREEKIYRMTR